MCLFVSSRRLFMYVHGLALIPGMKRSIFRIMLDRLYIKSRTLDSMICMPKGVILFVPIQSYR